MDELCCPSMCPRQGHQHYCREMGWKHVVFGGGSSESDCEGRALRAHIFEPRRTEPIWQVTKFCSRTHLHVQLQTAALRFIFPRPAGPPSSSPQSRLSALTRVRPSHRLVPARPRQATVSGDSDTPLIGQHRDRRGTNTVHTASRRSPAPVLCQCDERERRDETRTREQPHTPRPRARARSGQCPCASRESTRRPDRRTDTLHS